MARRLLIAMVAFLAPVFVQAQEPGGDAIREALAVLEERKADADNKEVQAQIDSAIVALEQLLLKDAEEGNRPKEVPALLIKSSILRKHFKGFSSAKDGKVTFVYDFRRKDQLNDFLPEGAKVEVDNGTPSRPFLRIPPAVKITHKARFKTVAVNGVFKVENPGPAIASTPFLGLSGGLELCTSADNGSTFKLAINGQQLITGDVGAEAPLGNSGSFKMLFKGRELAHKFVGPDRIDAAYSHRLELTDDRMPILTTTSLSKLASNKTFQLSELIEEGHAGEVLLYGGKGGTLIQSLTISGMPDEDWIKTLGK
jgi:hypothetical protein